MLSHSVMCWGTKEKDMVYCCVPGKDHDVCKFLRKETQWELDRIIACSNIALLQLQLSFEEMHLIGTHMAGFEVC